MTGHYEELEKLALDARGKKGRMDAESRHKASTTLASIWADPNLNPEATLPYLADLKAEALADGIGRCWGTMPRERRELFDRWLPAPDAERDVRRVAFMVGSIIDADPEWAMTWLHRLVPPGRKAISKDTRQHLAASLLTEAHQHSIRAALEQQQPRETLRLYTLLWDIAIDPAFSVSPVERARLARAILAFNPPQDSGVSRGALAEIDSRVRADVANWPTVLRQEYESTFPATDRAPLSVDVSQNTGPQSLSVLPEPDSARPGADAASLTSPTSPAPPSLSLAPDPTPLAVPAQRLGAEQPAPLLSKPPSLQEYQTHVAAAASGLQTLVPILQGLHSALGQWATDRDRLTTQLADVQRELSDIRVQLRAVETSRDAAQAESADHRERLQTLTSDITRLNQESDVERRRLSQQIAANASGRIDEYKTKLALTLSRLVVDLPNKHDAVTETLGHVVLLQFHQFLDALRQEGIEVRRGAGPR